MLQVAIGVILSILGMKYGWQYGLFGILIYMCTLYLATFIDKELD